MDNLHEVQQGTSASQVHIYSQVGSRDRWGNAPGARLAAAGMLAIQHVLDFSRSCLVRMPHASCSSFQQRTPPPPPPGTCLGLEGVDGVKAHVAALAHAASGMVHGRKCDTGAGGGADAGAAQTRSPREAELAAKRAMLEAARAGRPAPPHLMYSLNLTLPLRWVWLYPANTSSLMWKALQGEGGGPGGRATRHAG